MIPERYYEIQYQLDSLDTTARQSYIEQLSPDEQYDWITGSTPETESERKFRTAREIETVLVTTISIIFVIVLLVTNYFV